MRFYLHTHLSQMELGGKDAAVVCADADLAATASHIVKGAFSYSGQRCTGELSAHAVEGAGCCRAGASCMTIQHMLA